MNTSEKTAVVAQAPAQPEQKTTELEFNLTASESELLEEFGVLLAAEYNYATP